MKRRMVILLMVLPLSLGLAAGAGAAAYKVPKSICFETDANGDKITLTLKSLGSVKNGNGTVKMYNLNGVYLFNLGGGYYFSIPMTGTGYVHNYWEWFHATLTGAVNDTTNTWVFGAEVRVTQDDSGNVFGFENVVVTGGYGIPAPPEPTWGFYDSFGVTDCLGITFPYDTPQPKGALRESLKARAAKAAEGQK
jgi:hypothetical protein